MNRITIEEIVKAVNGSLLQQGSESYIDGVKQDSRECEAGDLFVAIKGDNLDGHTYIPQALENGCRTLLISDESRMPEENTYGGINVIKVNDTVYALGELAGYYLGTLNVKKVAVTGSVGKTSVRDMIYYVLSEKYNCGRNMKNYNNLIGLPLSIFCFDSSTEAVVLEMGMDRTGEIDRLAEIVKPHIGVITNIGMAHIENLGSRYGIFRAKMEIAKHIKGEYGKRGTLIYAADDEFLTRETTVGPYNQISVGKDGKSDYIISSIDDFGIEGIQFSLEHNEEIRKIKVPVPGMHNAVNSSLAVAVGNILGVTTEAAEKGLAKVELTGSRLKIVSGKSVRIIDDTYNASPDSMKSALKVLAGSRNSGRKTAILGDMYELGAESSRQHFGVGVFAGNLDIDTLIAVGEAAKHIAEGASGGRLKTLYYKSKEDLINDMDQFVGSRDLILVKGSRGMRMEQIVESILKY